MKKWKLAGLSWVCWYMGLTAAAWACGGLAVWYFLVDWQPLKRMGGGI